MDYWSSPKVGTTLNKKGPSNNSSGVVHGTKQYVNGTLIEEDVLGDAQIEVPKAQHKTSSTLTRILCRRPTEPAMPKSSIMKRSTTEVRQMKTNMVTFKDVSRRQSSETEDLESMEHENMRTSKAKVSGFKSVGGLRTLESQLSLLAANLEESANASPKSPSNSNKLSQGTVEESSLSNEIDRIPMISLISGGLNVAANPIAISFWELEEKWRKNLQQLRRKPIVGVTNKDIIERCGSQKKITEQNSKMVDQGEPDKCGGLVTTLLRAARDANEYLIKACLRDMIINGVSSEELNSTDKSGRTAVSYVCSNGLVQFLDIMLQLPEIDVNKADNEGNSPLHFAAEAGRADIIHMLITRRDRFLEIDAKNNLGFTPLMKAAIQGRTKCAKLLLFGGASPVVTDPKRKYRADQWARFCTQYSCAEMIETCSRARLLEKKVIARSNTGGLIGTTEAPPSTPSGAPPAAGGGGGGGGIRSKLRKVFPFGLALKDKDNGATNAKSKRSETSDLVSYLSAAALCASSGPALAKEQSAFIKKLIRHQDVPKLEVTYANNATLMKKYG